jgi:hypothetical protein
MSCPGLGAVDPALVVSVLSGSEGRERARVALGLSSTLFMMAALGRDMVIFGRAEDALEAHEMSMLSWSSLSQILPC